MPCSEWLHSETQGQGATLEEKNMKIDWELSWIETAEMAWWETHPDATEAEFEAAFYG